MISYDYQEWLSQIHTSFEFKDEMEMSFELKNSKERRGEGGC